LGDQLLTGNTQKPEGLLSLIVFLFLVFALPLMTWWYARRQKTLAPGKIEHLT